MVTPRRWICHGVQAGDGSLLRFCRSHKEDAYQVFRVHVALQKYLLGFLLALSSEAPKLTGADTGIGSK